MERTAFRASDLRGYYAIVDAKPEELSAAKLDALADRARRLLTADPCCLQLRAKGADGAALYGAALRLGNLCRDARVPFCVNDRLDVALAAQADVVHLGQDDLPLAAARRVRALANAKHLAIGFSTHSLEQALAAAMGGADYIGFGPIFSTDSKANPDPVVGIAMLAEVCAAVRIPVVAIGGLTIESMRSIAQAGSAAAAVISAVERADDPIRAGRAIAEAFAD